MKKVYDEYLYIPKHEKIREKVMLTRTAITVCIMVICLLAMGITAYAYFSANITSGSSTIKAANFETVVEVQITDSLGEAVDIETITSNYKTHKAFLEADKEYIVKITQSENNTAKTGFIIVKSDKCENIYHSQQLGTDETASGGKTKEIVFYLSVTDNAEVLFFSHWGTSSHYANFENKGENDELYITQNEKIIMHIESPANEKEDIQSN